MTYYVPGHPKVHMNLHMMHYRQEQGQQQQRLTLSPGPRSPLLLNPPPLSNNSVTRNPSNVSRRKGPPENQPSLLLSPEENQLVYEMLGNGRQTIATAVIQLLLPSEGHWKVRDVGVLCFVRDAIKKSYFLEVLSLRMMKPIFSQEIYEEFNYKRPNNQLNFLQFEGDELMVGLSFADKREMETFQIQLDNKITAKRKRQIARQSRMYDQASNGSIYGETGFASSSQYASPSALNSRPQIPNTSFGTIGRSDFRNTSPKVNITSGSATLPRIKATHVMTKDSETSLPITTSINLRNPGTMKKKTSKPNKQKQPEKVSPKKTKQKGNRGKKEKLSKADIGLPTNFIHIESAGFSQTLGFTSQVLNERYKAIFDKAGISKTQLEDSRTKKFIYNFIEEYDKNASFRNPEPGLHATQSIQHQHQGMSHQNLASYAPQPQSRQFEYPMPMPLASKGQSMQYQALVVPPPVPVRKQPAPSTQTPQPSGLTSQSIPAPPTLPPILAAHSQPNQPQISQENFRVQQEVKGMSIPLPPPLPMLNSLVDNARSLEQIEASSNNNGQGDQQDPLDDERSALMKQIQAGITLKKVEPGQKQNDNGISASGGDSTSGDDMDGLANALAKALELRALAINPTSSSSNDESDGDSESDDWK